MTGGVATASIELDDKAFRHWEVRGWRIAPGDYEVLAGRSATDIRLRGTVSR